MEIRRRWDSSGSPSALGAAALLVAGSLVACSGQGPMDIDSGAPAPLSPGLATQWVEIEAPDFLDEGEFFTGFSAGGRFWMLDRANQTMLHSTSDGVSWRTLPLEGEGVSQSSVLVTPDGRCGDRLVVGEREGVVELVYANSYNGSHPAGIVNAYHLVTIEDDAVSVTPMSELGLERMPPKQGDLGFRTSCVAGVYSVNGTRVALGSGQWWKPYETGRFDPFVAVEGSDRQWTVHAINDASDPGSFPIDAVLENDGVIVQFSATKEGVLALHSADGLAWERQLLAVDDREVGMVWASGGSEGVVVVAQIHDGAVDGLDEYSFHGWFSPDGVSWTGPVTLAERSESGLQLLSATAGGFYAAVNSRIPLDNGIEPTVLLHSTDGVTWNEVELELSSMIPLSNQVFSHGGGLVSFSRFSKTIMVSGLDWTAE